MERHRLPHLLHRLLGAAIACFSLLPSALAYDGDKYPDHPACLAAGVPQCLCEVNGVNKGQDSIYVSRWKERQARSKAVAATSHGHGPTPKNQVNSQSIVIFFDEGKSELDEQDRAQLRAFLESHRYDFSFSLDGNTDACGSVDGNVSLAQLRMAEVNRTLTDLARQMGIRVALTYEVNHDEQKSASHHEYDRNVIIRTSTDLGRPDAFLLPPEAQPRTGEIPGPSVAPPPHDVYDAMVKRCGDASTFLVDQSGSMSDHWAEVQMFPYPKEAKLLMGTMEACSRKARPWAPLMSVYPGGKTNI